MYSFKGTYHYAILFFLSLRMFKIYMYSHRNFTLYILYNFLSKRVPMNPWLYPDFPFREIMFIFSSFLVISQFPHILMSHDIYIYIYIGKILKNATLGACLLSSYPPFIPINITPKSQLYAQNGRDIIQSKVANRKKVTAQEKLRISITYLFA